LHRARVPHRGSRDAHTDADARGRDADPYADAGSRRDADAYPNADAAADRDADAHPDADPDADAYAHPDTDAGPHGDADRGADLRAECDQRSRRAARNGRELCRARRLDGDQRRHHARDR
jgi:hypothetical protein